MIYSELEVQNGPQPAVELEGRSSLAHLQSTMSNRTRLFWFISLPVHSKDFISAQELNVSLILDQTEQSTSCVQHELTEQFRVLIKLTDVGLVFNSVVSSKKNQIKNIPYHQFY